MLYQRLRGTILLWLLETTQFMTNGVQFSPIKITKFSLCGCPMAITQPIHHEVLLHIPNSNP